MSQSKRYVYERIPDEEYKKAVGQLRLQLNGVMKVFDMYGLGEFIPGAIAEVIDLCEQFGMRVRKKDEPIFLLRERNPR